MFLFTVVPLDVTEAALDETDAVTDAPLNSQTTSSGLTGSGAFRTTSTNELHYGKKESWEKSPRDSATDSAPRVLASGYDSEFSSDDDAYYDNNFSATSREGASRWAAETQQNQPGSGPSRIRSRYQAAHTHLTDTLSTHTRMPHIWTEAVKPVARSPSAMRRNVDAQARASDETEPDRAKMASDVGEVRWVRVGQRDDGEDVSMETTGTESGVTLDAQPKLHRRPKGAVAFFTFKKHYVWHKERLLFFNDNQAHQHFLIT